LVVEVDERFDVLDQANSFGLLWKLIGKMNRSERVWIAGGKRGGARAEDAFKKGNSDSPWPLLD
jgi:hypothetical protein